MKVPLLDLQAQYATIRDDVRAAIDRVFESQQFVLGAEVQALEEEIARYSQTKFAVGCASGSDALLLALMSCGIGDGDEVITTPFSFFATASAITRLGARPVFVDVDEETYNLRPSLVVGAITERTKAIMPVHLYGHPCDMTALMEVAQQRNMLVIEDACQALGATWQGTKCGTFGTGCLSFYATKSITTGGEGGMVVTNDDRIARRARLLRNQGEEERYVTELLAYNFRMTEIAAAIGAAQLPKLDGWTERRRANAAWLNEHLDGVVTPVERAGAHHTYQQYTVRVENGRRDALRATLREQDIETAVYYPKALHEQPLYQQLGIGGSFPVAERATQEVLSVPVHPALSAQDLERIASAVNGAMAAAGASRG